MKESLRIDPPTLSHLPLPEKTQIARESVYWMHNCAVQLSINWITADRIRMGREYVTIQWCVILSLFSLELLHVVIDACHT